MMEVKVTKTTNPKVKPDPATVPFGVAFTDHMFIMDYSDEKGWYDPRIVPFQNISLSPAACVFHYGAEVFEGLKAYRRPDGEVQLFRPWDNMERMKNSAIRLGLPVVPPEDALLTSAGSPLIPAPLCTSVPSCTVPMRSWGFTAFTQPSSSSFSPR